MLYEVLLTRKIAKTIQLEAASPQEAARLAEGLDYSFQATSVEEMVPDEEGSGTWFEVAGKCTGCGATLLDDKYVMYGDDCVMFCTPGQGCAAAEEPLGEPV